MTNGYSCWGPATYSFNFWFQDPCCIIQDLLSCKLYYPRPLHKIATPVWSKINDMGIGCQRWRPFIKNLDVNWTGPWIQTPSTERDRDSFVWTQVLLQWHATHAVFYATVPHLIVIITELFASLSLASSVETKAFLTWTCSAIAFFPRQDMNMCCFEWW